MLYFSHILWFQTYTNYVIYFQHIRRVSASLKYAILASCAYRLHYIQ